MTQSVSAPSSRTAGRVATATWLASVALILFLVRSTPSASLQEQLKVWQVWSLDVCVLLGVVLGVARAVALKQELTRADVIRMAVVAIAGMGLTLFVAPRTHRIFYDEQIYQSIGQNIADLRLAQRCSDGEVRDGRLRCERGAYNKQPYAYPHLLGIAYRLSGAREGTAFAVNAAAMGAVICAVYLLVVALFADRIAAFFAALLMTLTPQQIAWSATAAVEPTASLGIVAAVLAAALYRRSGHWTALMLTAVSAAYAMQFRPESIVALPVILLVMWPRLQPDLERPQAWWAAILFLWLMAVHLAHLYVVRSVDWGAVGRARFSFDYFLTNAAVNVPFYIYDQRFPVAFTALAVIGLWGSANWLLRLAMVVWFLLFLTIVLFFYAGSYDYGADIRYSLMTYPPLAVLGGVGAARLARLGRGVFAGARLVYALAATLALQFIWYAPRIVSMDEAWAARADVRFARDSTAQLPANSYVFTHNPGMFHLWGISAGQVSRLSEDPALAASLSQRYSGGVYLHWNFWCNVPDAVQQEFCRKARSLAPVEVVAQYSEREQFYAFYRIRVKN
jgi:hypothetical protein